MESPTSDSRHDRITKELPLIGEPLASVSQRYAGLDIVTPYLYL